MPDLTEATRELRARIANTLLTLPPELADGGDGRVGVLVPLTALTAVLDAVETPADEWVLAAERLPDTDDIVLARTASGDTRELRWRSGMWFLPDRSMYTYFGVEAWKAL
jgi:hypothetical protein